MRGVWKIGFFKMKELDRSSGYKYGATYTSKGPFFGFFGITHNSLIESTAYPLSPRTLHSVTPHYALHTTFT
jgi:hypothetical protein